MLKLNYYNFKFKQMSPENRQENALENVKVTGIEFSSQDGATMWREEFEGGAVGHWNDAGINTDNTAGFEKLRKELLRERGLLEEEN